MNEHRPPDPNATGAYDAAAPTPAERFAPGAVLAGRYRIVAALGKGGMGEVRRADDLTLGQPVALKFLPPHLADDSGRLARFRKEVAIARKVSHAIGCRAYDPTGARVGGIALRKSQRGFVESGCGAVVWTRFTGHVTGDRGALGHFARELVLTSETD